jgi:hypothetical protein
MPEQDAVLAVTSAIEIMQDVLDLTYEHLLPAMNTGVLEPSPHHTQLLDQLANLNLAPIQGQKDSPVAKAVSGKTYRLEKSQENLQTVTLHFHDDNCSLSLSDGQQEHLVMCGYSAWMSSVTTLPAEVNLFHSHPDKIEASGAWTDASTFVVKIIYVETPHCLTAAFYFDGDKLTLKRKWNVSFGPLNLPEVRGYTTA